MIKSKRFFWVTLVITINLILLFSMYTFSTDQNVTVSIVPKPKIDIILAKSKTVTDVTNFEENMLQELKNQNIDTSDVKISAVQAEQVDLTNSFTWGSDVSSSIGSISIVNNGQSVTMRGNPSNPGKNAIWIIPDKQNEDQKFTFSYNIDFGDSFNAAGMLLKVKREGNVLTGYMLSFNNSNWNSASGGYNGAIWEFNYVIGQNTVNMTKTLKKGLSINKSGTLTVSTTDTEITIEGGGLSSKVVYTLEKEFGNGYGFFSDHYSHGCDSIGSFTLQNINLQTTDTKKFDEVLRLSDWRTSSYRFLVNVTDRMNNELAESSTYGELTTRLINDNIYFLGWGNNSNQQQFEQLIMQNENKGVFINNTNYNNSIIQTAQYIKSVLDKIESSEYVVVNEPVNIIVNPESAKNNTVDANWPYGKWKIIHEYEYYENNMGQFADSGKYVSDFISTFDKTGRYKITYEDREITPKYIYVHRKPVASFVMGLSNGIVTLQSNSYDLDCMSNNNGIAEEEWKWKTSDQTTWNEGKLTSYDSDKTYLIQLKVKDFQETWSDPTTKFIYNGADTLPVAMFNIKEDTITKYEQLDVENQSYDPSGKGITSYLWEIYSGTELKYSGNTIPTDFLNYELGNYTLYLTVTNSINNKSERVSRPFTIIDDTIAPEVVVTPVESDWTTSIMVNMKFSDKGGSKFKSYRYAITDSQQEPSQWSDDILEENSSVIIDQEGINKYLHIIAQDNAGNISQDRVVGPYKIDRTGPEINVSADLQTITTQSVKLIANVNDVLSGVKSITINGQEYQNGQEFQITRNGTYNIVALDNLGNQSSKEIVVNNINRVCTEGLEHPDYNSSYDECPICALLKNINIKQSSYTYDSKAHRVQYNNPDNIKIVEYYNDTSNIPVDVGNYNYELKVVYDEKEYKTHFKDVLSITRKSINIMDIKAVNREYNATNIVKLSGGVLQGIEDKDKGQVDFVLPEDGTIENKDVGKYFVSVPQVNLTGNRSFNYELIQPNLEDVGVEITQKNITITGIKAEDRQYNATNIVNLSEGRLQGIEEIDKEKVGFILPEEGTIESKNIGEYFVTIPNIELIGEESKNYKLKQPDLQDVSVEIMQKDISIADIKAANRQYDATNIVTLSGGKLQGIEEIDSEKVGFILPEEGTIENKNIGEYFVTIPNIELTGEESQNYKLKQPELQDVSVEIMQKDISITDIKAANRQYDATNIVKINGGILQGIEEIDKEKVGFILPEEGTIENKNIGEYFVKIPNIELIGEESKNYKLKQPELQDVQVEIIQKDITIREISGVDKLYDKNNIVKIAGGKLIGVENKEKVTFILPETGEAQSANVGKWSVKIDDILLDGEDKANYNLIQPEFDDIKVLILEPNVPALYMETKVKEMNNKEYSGAEDIIRVANNYTVKLSIKIKNKGEGAGYAQKVKLELPKNVEMVQEETNELYGWKQEENNIVSTEKLKFENGVENEIAGTISYNSQENQSTENKEEELEIYLKIKDLNKEYENIPIKLNLIQTDNNNKVIENKVESTSSVIVLRSNYTKMQIKENSYSLNGREIDNTSVEQRDIVIFKSKIYNKGEIPTYVTKIINYAAEGLEYLPENEINKKYKWTMVDESGEQTKDIKKAVKFETEYLKDKKIVSSLEEQKDYEEIQIAFKVSDIKEKNKELQNAVQIEECQDQYKNIVENIIEENEQISKTSIKVKYFDLSLKQKIEKINVYENGILITEIINQNNNNTVMKLEINRKKVNKTSIKVIFNIEITNEGEIAGYAKEIKDYLPSGLEFLQEDNKNWKENGKNNITTNQLEKEIINPGETKTLSLILTWKNTQENFGMFTNAVEISKDYNLSETLDIDSEPDNAVENEDDYDEQKIIISLSTGGITITIYIICIIILLVFILILTVFLIKFVRNNKRKIDIG